jgi:hypothetical protein
VLLVLRIGEDVEQIRVAEGTAAIFRRTGARAGDAARSVRVLGVDDRLDGDAVLPAVAEIVDDLYE